MSKSYPPHQPFFVHLKLHGWAYFLSLSLFCLQDQVYGATLASDPILNTPLSLKLDDQLQLPAPVADSLVPTFTKSQDVEGVNDRNMILKKDAEIRRNGTVIKGDELDYNLDTDIAIGEGNVKFNKPNASFAGPRGQIKLDSKQGWMETPSYEIKESHGSGMAQYAEFLDDDRTYLTKPTYSTCSPQNLDWYFSASNLLIDQSTNDATGENGVLHFFDTPIFYMPYFSVPLGSDRRSGFLPPTIGLNTNTGFDITSPYYLNIAPNRDLTLYPRYMSKRGVQLGGEFRYLEPTYSGIFKAEYLPNDNIYGADRWAYSWQHQQFLGPGLTAYANINRVSDDLYADDLGRSVGQAITRQYTQEAGLNYYVDGWNFLTRVQKYQTLQPDPTNIVVAPYDREPELNAMYRNLDFNGSIFSFQGNLTRFTYAGPLDAVTPGSIPNRGYYSADRGFINTSIAYPFTTPGYYLTPKITLRANTYDMIGNDSYPGLTQNFAVPIMSLDSGLFFERDAPELKSIFGRDMLLTFEPRAFYVYSPYRDQSQIPLFDTAAAGFGIAQIFSENTFVGNDRIADNNKLTVGVSSKILDADTGVERIRGVIAQRFDFTGQQVGLYGNQVTTPGYSDILVGASTRLSQNVNIDFADQYNQSINRTTQSSTTASWRPAPRKMLNASYRYTFDPNLLDTTVYQYEISGQWPVSKSVNLIGRWNYDKVTNQTLNTLAGLEYDQECWALRVAFNRYVNTAQQSTSQIFFQIEFKGLTGVGNNPIDIMKLNIPGYIPSNQKPLPLSRFETYE
jgi:LPS-assembly protein